MSAAFTFICLGKNQASTHVDLQTMEPDAMCTHALRLLFGHLIADTVEIWRDPGAATD